MRKTQLLYGMGLFLCGLLIFSLGIEIGNGNIRINFLQSSQTKNSQLPSALDYSSVTQLYDILKSDYNGSLTEEGLVDGLKRGLAEATNDPYTEYFTAAEAKTFNNELNNSFSGIGAELGKDGQGNLIIVAPIKGYPADAAGLKSQDIIADIDGQSTNNMSLASAVNKIRGPKGSKVTLTIVRDNSDERTFGIVRADIQVPSVSSKVLPNNVGYMQITTFSDDTASRAEQTARQFKQEGVRGIVLDLRGNPGGLLDAAVNVSSLWLPEGATIVTEKGTIGSTAYPATGNNILRNIPTVVLIDGGSASASEITAGALHDNNAARLIGVRSYGKGVVQQIIPLHDGGELKVTVASWYRPNGQNIHKKGIEPDEVVNSSREGSSDNDSQLTAALNYLNSH